MPYVSRAQARYFHANPKLRKYTAEFDAATDFNNLPERSSKKHGTVPHRKHSKIAESLMRR